MQGGAAPSSTSMRPLLPSTLPLPQPHGTCSGSLHCASACSAWSGQSHTCCTWPLCWTSGCVCACALPSPTAAPSLQLSCSPSCSAPMPPLLLRPSSTPQTSLLLRTCPASSILQLASLIPSARPRHLALSNHLHRHHHHRQQQPRYHQQCCSVMRWAPAYPLFHLRCRHSCCVTGSSPPPPLSFLHPPLHLMRFTLQAAASNAAVLRPEERPNHAPPPCRCQAC